MNKPGYITSIAPDGSKRLIELPSGRSISVTQEELSKALSDINYCHKLMAEKKR